LFEHIFVQTYFFKHLFVRTYYVLFEHILFQQFVAQAAFFTNHFSNIFNHTTFVHKTFVLIFLIPFLI
jgi:hypothetical protein